MKKLILSAFCFFLMLQFTNAQEWWFDAGLKVAYGSGALLNKNILDNDDFSYDLASNFAFGGKIGANYGPNNGVTIDVMSGKFKSSFELPDKTNEVVKWNTLDLYLMYRRNGNLAYFEVGPKMSFVNESTRGALDLTDQTDNFYSGVLGFGWFVLGNEGRFSGVLGFRLEYGFTDIANAAGETAGYPLPGAQPPISSADYAKSSPVVASLVFELNWGIGKFAQNTCGARRKFVFF